MPCAYKKGALKRIWQILYAQLVAEMSPADADRLASAQTDSIAAEMGREQIYIGKRNDLRKRDEMMRELHRGGMSTTDLMKRYDLSRSNVNYILSRQ